MRTLVCNKKSIVFLCFGMDRIEKGLLLSFLKKKVKEQTLKVYILYYRSKKRNKNAINQFNDFQMLLLFVHE